MGYKCCVAGCKSGYDSSKSTDSQNISFFAFPFDKPLRLKWINACLRRDFKPAKFSRVCSLHFEENDFQIESTEQIQSRLLKKRYLKQRRLKPNAIPRLHANLPSRLEKRSDPVSVTSNATSTARLATENQRRKGCLRKILARRWIF